MIQLYYICTIFGLVHIRNLVLKFRTCVNIRATVSGGKGCDRHRKTSDRTAGQYSINTRNSSMLLPPPTGRLPLADVLNVTILQNWKNTLLMFQSLEITRLTPVLVAAGKMA